MQPVLIKKYLNRKMYVPRGNTEPTGYITLGEITKLIQKGKSIKVVDNNGDEITESVLKEVIKYIDLDIELLYSLIRGSNGKV